MLRDLFITLLQKYTTDIQLGEQLWRELEKLYSGKRRYYHNLSHLNNMYNELIAVKQLANDWDTLLFSLFYHDSIYKVPGKDNEERSAALANKRLSLTGFPVEKINQVAYQVLATKTHRISGDKDTNLLLDADLSVLGKSPDLYNAYTKQIRKEYGIYPGFLYKPGRKKVLQHFLQKDRIFKTGHFYNKYEKQARKNLLNEMGEL